MNKDKLETSEQYKENSKSNRPNVSIKFLDLEINSDKNSQGSKINFSFNLFSKTGKTDRNRLSENSNDYDNETQYSSKTYLIYVILFTILFTLMFNIIFKKKPVVEEVTQQSQELFNLK